LPQMAMLVTEATVPPLWASWALARFSSKRSWRTSGRPGTSGALERAIRQLGVQGLPTTRMRTSRRLLAMARPCGLKMPPLTLSRSPRSMPALRGTEPTRRAHEVPSNAV